MQVELGSEGRAQVGSVFVTWLQWAQGKTLQFPVCRHGRGRHKGHVGEEDGVEQEEQEGASELSKARLFLSPLPSPGYWIRIFPSVIRFPRPFPTSLSTKADTAICHHDPSFMRDL